MEMKSRREKGAVLVRVGIKDLNPNLKVSSTLERIQHQMQTKYKDRNSQRDYRVKESQHEMSKFKEGKGETEMYMMGEVVF